jgi:CBS domain containing-hemolysin-like protein
MVPRMEIVAIKSDATVENILDLIVKYRHTRMPVLLLLENQLLARR